MISLFEDRRDAGKKLAKALKASHYEDAVFLALPRGGVIIADEVAKKFNKKFDVVISRKIGAPDQPEFGIGAISEDDTPIFNRSILNYYNPQDHRVQRIVLQEIEELHRRIKLYRNGKRLSGFENKTVVVIDDGLATGVTAIAAAKYLRSLHPKKIVLAVPLGPANVGIDVLNAYDDIICLHSIENMQSVGMWYKKFNQVEDDEVKEILKNS